MNVSYRVICHHGIKGQKWGERNGPPYPLDEKDKSAKEKSEERKSINWKKVGTAAAITAGVALAAYGGYKLSKTKSFRSIGKKKIDEIGAGGIDLSETPDWLKPTDGFVHDVQADFRGINPTRNQRGNIPISSFTPELLADDGLVLSEVNCQSCSYAHELRCRGINAIASLIDTRKEGDISQFVYKDAKPEIMSFKNGSELASKLLSFGEGARGNIVMSTPDGKHSVRFEVHNGVAAILDCQKEVGFDSTRDAAWSLYRADMSNLSVLRTDNLELNTNEMKISKYATFLDK